MCSDRLVARLHQDLVDGHVVWLAQRIDDRCGDILRVQNARSTGLAVALQCLRIVAQRRKLGCNVTRLNGGHLEPRTGRLESQPLRQRFNEELATRIDSQTRKDLTTGV
jgi:hypothetical protein